MAAIPKKPIEGSQLSQVKPPEYADYDAFFSLCEKVQELKKSPLFVGVITFKKPGDDLSDFSTKKHYGLIENISEETTEYKIYTEIMFGKLSLFERGVDIVSRDLMAQGLQKVRIISREELKNYKLPEKVQEATFFEDIS